MEINYTQHYQQIIKRRREKLVSLEIGVGGYKDPSRVGSSHRMCRRFFQNSLIVGIDIEVKRSLEEKGIKIDHGSQVNFQEFSKPGYQPSYFDYNITSVTFDHNLVFIQKDGNNEVINVIRENEELIVLGSVQFKRRK